MIGPRRRPLLYATGRGLCLSAALVAGVMLAFPTVRIASAGAPATLSEQIEPAFSGVSDPRWQADMFKKWEGVKGRNRDQIAVGGPTCRPARAGGIGQCILPEWKQFVDALKAAERTKKLNATNLEMNRRSYVQDLVNWGQSDFWETPVEFFQRNGDCEDFAIAKFFTLLYAGLHNDVMKVVIVNEMNLGIAHAVFAIDTEDGIMILDNQIKAVVRADRIYHYRAIYALDLTGAWVFH